MLLFFVFLSHNSVEEGSVYELIYEYCLNCFMINRHGNLQNNGDGREVGTNTGALRQKRFKDLD